MFVYGNFTLFPIIYLIRSLNVLQIFTLFVSRGNSEGKDVCADTSLK